MEDIKLIEKLRDKANISYEEAKEVLEKNNWDILDAIIYLEKKGKIKGIVRAYGFPILFGIIFACMLVYFVRPSQIEGESKVI